MYHLCHIESFTKETKNSIIMNRQVNLMKRFNYMLYVVNVLCLCTANSHNLKKYIIKYNIFTVRRGITKPMDKLHHILCSRQFLVMLQRVLRKFIV